MSPAMISAVPSTCRRLSQAGRKWLLRCDTIVTGFRLDGGPPAAAILFLMVPTARRAPHGAAVDSAGLVILMTAQPVSRTALLPARCGPQRGRSAGAVCGGGSDPRIAGFPSSVTQCHTPAT